MLQNCNIFNDGAWRSFTDREVRDDRMLVLEHGKPMIFGKDRDKGIRLRGLHPEVVQLGDGVTEADLLVHDEKAEDPYLAFMLSRMFWPEFPVPVGVLRAIERPTHDQLMTEQITRAVAEAGRRRPAEAPEQRRDVGRELAAGCGLVAGFGPFAWGARNGPNWRVSGLKCAPDEESVPKSAPGAQVASPRRHPDRCYMHWVQRASSSVASPPTAALTG